MCYAMQCHPTIFLLLISRLGRRLLAAISGVPLAREYGASLRPFSCIRNDWNLVYAIRKCKEKMSFSITEAICAHRSCGKSSSV